METDSATPPAARPMPAAHLSLPPSALPGAQRKLQVSRDREADRGTDSCADLLEAPGAWESSGS